MKISNNLFLGAMVALLAFSSCDKAKDDTYDIPTTYNFDNVDYSGQTQRLDMLSEISAYAKSTNVANATALDAVKLKDMYANTNAQFSDATLSASTKTIKDKMVSSTQSTFDTYIDALATASQSTAATAANGTAGIITNNDNSKSYLLNANGVELAQVLEKGIMGACFYYQGTAVYLGSGKIDVDNEAIVDGQGTSMEHHWDEAFGYFGVPTDFPTNTTDLRFWGKYTNLHETVYPLNDKIMDAFLKGRAAISNDDMDARDEAIATIRKNWELVVAASAIHYINEAINSSDAAVDHHSLSEAFGFLMGLKYGVGTLTVANVESLLTDTFGSNDPLQVNLYNVTNAKLETAKTTLVGLLTDLSAEKDNL